MNIQNHSSINELKRLANAPLGTHWKTDGQGHFKKLEGLSGFFDRLVEFIRELLGCGNATNPEAIEYEVIRLISQGAKQGAFNHEELEVISRAAKQCGLVPNNQASEERHCELHGIIREIQSRRPETDYNRLMKQYYIAHEEALRNLAWTKPIQDLLPIPTEELVEFFEENIKEEEKSGDDDHSQDEQTASQETPKPEPVLFSKDPLDQIVNYAALEKTLSSLKGETNVRTLIDGIIEELLGEPLPKERRTLDKWLTKALQIADEGPQQAELLDNIEEKLGLSNAVVFLARGYQLAYHLSRFGTDEEKRDSLEALKLFKEKIEALIIKDPAAFDNIDSKWNQAEISEQFLAELNAEDETLLKQAERKKRVARAALGALTAIPFLFSLYLYMMNQENPEAVPGTGFDDWYRERTFYSPNAFFKWPIEVLSSPTENEIIPLTENNTCSPSWVENSLTYLGPAGLVALTIAGIVLNIFPNSRNKKEMPEGLRTDVEKRPVNLNQDDLEFAQNVLPPYLQEAFADNSKDMSQEELGSLFKNLEAINGYEKELNKEKQSLPEKLKQALDFTDRQNRLEADTKGNLASWIAIQLVEKPKVLKSLRRITSFYRTLEVAKEKILMWRKPDKEMQLYGAQQIENAIEKYKGSEEKFFKDMEQLSAGDLATLADLLQEGQKELAKLTMTDPPICPLWEQLQKLDVKSDDYNTIWNFLIQQTPTKFDEYCNKLASLKATISDESHHKWIEQQEEISKGFAKELEIMPPPKENISHFQKIWEWIENGDKEIRTFDKKERALASVAIPKNLNHVDRKALIKLLEFNEDVNDEMSEKELAEKYRKNISQLRTAFQLYTPKNIPQVNEEHNLNTIKTKLKKIENRIEKLKTKEKSLENEVKLYAYKKRHDEIQEKLNLAKPSAKAVRVKLPTLLD